MSMEEVKEKREHEKEKRNMKREEREVKKDIRSMKYNVYMLIGKILNFITRHLILSIVIVALFALSAYKIGSFVFFKKTGETTINTSMRGYKKIDTLFTSFAYVPIIDFKDKNSLFSSNPDLASGYCLRRYEVGIGYKDVHQIYANNKYKICVEKDISALPVPTIISINPVSSEIYGSFTQQECDNYDKKKDGYVKSREQVGMYINNKYGDKLAQGSKEMLMVFLKGYCTKEDMTANLDKNNIAK